MYSLIFNNIINFKIKDEIDIIKHAFNHAVFKYFFYKKKDF